MIFQIAYQSDDYDDFIDYNFEVHSKYPFDYQVYCDDDINYFLRHYGYYDIFNNLEVHPKYIHQGNAIKCDFIRIMMLYELGGIYIDCDSIFKPEICCLETDLNYMFKNRNLIMHTGSLHFVRGIQRSEYMEYLKDMYLVTKPLTLDIHMLKKRNLVKFKDEVCLLSDSFTKTYFEHKSAGDHRVL